MGTISNNKALRGAAVILIVACLIGCLSGCAVKKHLEDILKPHSSAEEREEMNQQYGDTVVYWTANGKSYHLYDDCSFMSRSEELIYGTVEQAIEAGKTRICRSCEQRYENGELQENEEPDG